MSKIMDEQSILFICMSKYTIPKPLVSFLQDLFFDYSKVLLREILTFLEGKKIFFSSQVHLQISWQCQSWERKKQGFL